MSAVPPPSARASISREQWLITSAVMAGLAVAALDATVVATAMPTIVGNLGGVGRYGWVFSAYLLTATTTVPLFARLSDMRGRRPVFLAGLALFVLGSVLCGLSGSVTQLILFRAVQGLGAGAVQPVALTIIGDIFEPEVRARMQGMFASVWGVSAVAGPALGGWITTSIGWRWVFFVNVPVGAAAATMLVIALREDVSGRRHRLDWVGAATLSGAILLLLLAVSEVGGRMGWSSGLFVGMLAGAAGLATAFVRLELRTAEPLIDLTLLRRPLLAAGLSLQVLAGGVLFGLQGYVPPMIQGVHGRTPLAAGAAVAAMSIGWPVASVIAGRWLVRSGSRTPVLAGVVALVTGTLLLTQLQHVAALGYAVLASAVVGLGMGFMNTTIMVAVQSGVEWQRRGVATGLVQFSRTIGGAVGVGLLGAVLSAHAGPEASALLRGDRAGGLEEAAQGLASGLTIIYVALVAMAVVAAGVAIRWMPSVDVRGQGQPQRG
ncbi:MAG TPA: MDR family MFS transporter [Egibacteraceae bacterium]|nr:MDR family MFS transporter [Egibacteraceae bacterium]